LGYNLGSIPVLVGADKIIMGNTGQFSPADLMTVNPFNPIEELTMHARPNTSFAVVLPFTIRRKQLLLIGCGIFNNWGIFRRGVGKYSAITVRLTIQ
jgi:hypothetical protein